MFGRPYAQAHDSVLVRETRRYSPHLPNMTPHITGVRETSGKVSIFANLLYVSVFLRPLLMLLLLCLAFVLYLDVLFR